MNRVVIQVWHGSKSAGYVTMNTIRPLTTELQEAAVFWTKRDAVRWMSQHKNRRSIIEKDTTFTYDVVIFSVAQDSLADPKQIEWETDDTGC